MPASNGENMNIDFADDVTQVIQNFNNDKHKLAKNTITEMKKNKYIQMKMENTNQFDKT